MQHRNEDIEALYRKAADDYPLNTSNANWDKVASQLDFSQPPLPLARKTDERKIILAVLLLISIPALLYFYNHNRDLEAPTKATVASKLQKQPEHFAPPTGSSMLPATAGNVQQLVESPARSNKVSLLSIPVKNSIEHIITAHTIVNSVPGLAAAGTTGINEPVSLSFSTDETTRQTTTLIELPSSPIAAQSKVDIPATQTQEISLSNTSSESGTKSLISLNPGVPRFYVNLSAAPQLSFAGMQQAQRPGLKYGITAGYNFNHQWAVELGVFRNQQYFYTNAAHFSRDDLKFWPTTTITGIKGYNYITEFPLSVKYDLAVSKKQQHYFATAGVSSQLLNSERYWYNLNKNNVRDTSVLKLYGRYRDLKLFSGVHFSAGYEAPVFNNFAKVRVEPYVKIPVRGSGVGNVRVTEFGISVGITKSFK